MPWLSTSASGRLDLLSDFGAFFSPRVSVLAKPVTGWSARLSMVFVNAENLADWRQTTHVPIVRPARAPDGSWLDDEWGPLDGRVFNAGVRLRF